MSLDALIPGGHRRYVALGDSFTEGVGDPDPTRPNGVRGWADRVAEALAQRTEGFGYANLAIRGRKLPAIIDEQLDAAVALRPDLVTIYAGGNDILRPRVDIDALMARYEGAVARLVGTGADVLVFTAFAATEGIYKPMRGRWAYYNELVREIADRHRVHVVDYWRMREYRDWGYWDDDRLHMAPEGHALMAQKVLDVLGVPHGDAPAPRQRPVLTRAEQRAANWLWTREHLGPWIKRRVTGRSSGDGLSPKYPTYVSPLDLANGGGTSTSAPLVR